MDAQISASYLGSYPYHNKNGVILDSAFNNSGAYLAVCNTNGQVYVYATTSEESKKPFKTYKNHKGAALKVCWSHSKTKFILASCSIDRTINFYNEEEAYMVIDTKEVIPTCIAFAPIDDIILVVGLSSGNLRLYDSKGNQNFDLVAHESAVSCLEWNYQYDKTNIEVFKKNLQKISIYPQKLMLATGSSDTTVKIWEMLKGIRYELKLVIALKTHVKQIRSLSWRSILMQRFIQLTTASNDGVVKHWELDFEKGVQKEIYNKKLGKTIWKVGWDQFGSLLCVSLLTTDNTNETYLFELQGNEFYKKSQLTEDED